MQVRADGGGCRGSEREGSLTSGHLLLHVSWEAAATPLVNALARAPWVQQNAGAEIYNNRV